MAAPDEVVALVEKLAAADSSRERLRLLLGSARLLASLDRGQRFEVARTLGGGWLRRRYEEFCEKLDRSGAGEALEQLSRSAGGLLDLGPPVAPAPPAPSEPAGSAAAVRPRYVASNPGSTTPDDGEVAVEGREGDSPRESASRTAGQAPPPRVADGASSAIIDDRGKTESLRMPGRRPEGRRDGPKPLREPAPPAPQPVPPATRRAVSAPREEAASARETGGAWAELRELRGHPERWRDAGPAARRELIERLGGGWAARRALFALLEEGSLTDWREGLALAERIDRAWDRDWCLVRLAEIAPDEASRRQIAERIGSVVRRRAFERRVRLR